MPGNANSHKLTPAQSGKKNNTNGSTENKLWGRALHKQLREFKEGFDGPRCEKYWALQEIAKTVIREAIAGNMVAVQEIGNRCDGKSTEHKIVDKSVTHDFGDVSEAFGILSAFAGQRQDDDDAGTVSH